MPKKAPFELPDDECERLTRQEMACCRIIMVLASDLHYAQDDLAQRLMSVPYGKERLRMLIGGVDSLFKDILGTISDRQRRQLRNQAKDMTMKAVPKLTHTQNKVMIYLDEVKELVNCAKEKCVGCVESDEDARKCRVYKWLEANVPLDDYGDGLICPYARIDWGEKDE